MRVLHVCLDQKTVEFLAAERIDASGVDEHDISVDAVVDWCASGEFDAVIIDLDKSDFGVYFPRTFRARQKKIPIIGIAGKDPERSFSEIHALFLENGGDYLIEGPPNPRLLVAAVRAVTRRINDNALDVLTHELGALTLKLNRTLEVLSINGTTVVLTPQEYRIAEIIIVGNGKVQSKAIIHSHLYSLEVDEAEIKIIDVLVCKIRNKLNNAVHGAGEFISTSWGRGYLLGADTARKA